MKKYRLFSSWLANMALISVLMLGVLLTMPDRASAISAVPALPLAPCASTAHPQIPPPPQRPSWSSTTWHFGWFATCSEATWQFYIGTTTSSVTTSAVGVDIDLKCGGSTQNVPVSLYDANDQVINTINAPCNSKSSQQLATKGLKTGVKYRVNYDQTVQNVAASYVVYSWPVNPGTGQFNPAPQPPPGNTTPPTGTNSCPPGVTGPSGEPCMIMTNCPSGYGYVNGNNVGICLAAPAGPSSGGAPPQTAIDYCMAGYLKDNGTYDGPTAHMLCSASPPGYIAYRECRTGGGTAAICGSGITDQIYTDTFNSGPDGVHDSTISIEYLKNISITGTIQCDHVGSVTIDIFSDTISDPNAPKFYTSTGASCDSAGVAVNWSLPPTAVPDGLNQVTITMDWKGNCGTECFPTISGSYVVSGTTV